MFALAQPLNYLSMEHFVGGRGGELWHIIAKLPLHHLYLSKRASSLALGQYNQCDCFGFHTLEGPAPSDSSWVMELLPIPFVLSAYCSSREQWHPLELGKGEKMSPIVQNVS